MEKTTRTLDEFIAALGLTMTAEPTARNPNADDNEWSKGASHWACAIKRGGATLDTFYSMGSAHRTWKKVKWHYDFPFAFTSQIKPGQRVHTPPKAWVNWDEFVRVASEPIPPTLRDVLDSLAMDASGYDNAQDFEHWAEDLGMDADSRKAERCYRVTGEQSKRLRHLLGGEAYTELLESIERL